MQNEALFSICPLLLPQDKNGLTYDGFIEINVSASFNTTMIICRPFALYSPYLFLASKTAKVLNAPKREITMESKMYCVMAFACPKM
jgi:hypothetical protein